MSGLSLEADPLWAGFGGRLAGGAAFAVLLLFAEMTVMLLQLGWLMRRSARRWAAKRWEARFSARLGDRLLELIHQPAPSARLFELWVAEALDHPRAVVQPHLLGLLAITAGSAHHKLVEIYRALGLLGEDLRLLRALRAASRIRALRRLSLVAEPGQRWVLPPELGGRHLAHVLVAQIVARAETSPASYPNPEAAR